MTSVLCGPPTRSKATWNSTCLRSTGIFTQACQNDRKREPETPVCHRPLNSFQPRPASQISPGYPGYVALQAAFKVPTSKPTHSLQATGTKSSLLCSVTDKERKQQPVFQILHRYRILHIAYRIAYRPDVESLDLAVCAPSSHHTEPRTAVWEGRVTPLLATNPHRGVLAIADAQPTKQLLNRQLYQTEQCRHHYQSVHFLFATLPPPS